mgnify:FL=1|tara:strand:+ start:18095 stop:19009 length:915 start_codon:yes stop_codon:yes gene_type:complete
MNIKTPKDLAIAARKQGKTTISYSQINMYKNCPLQWKLTYVDKIRDFEPSMFLVFGTAMHEVLQTYLDTMYKDSIVNANKLDLHKQLSDTMKLEYKKAVDEQDGKHFSFSEEINDFYNDGVEIIEEFKRRRGAYFSKKNTELLGVEIPILCPVDGSDKIMVMGFVDLVMKEGDRIKIIDIKTSMFGWKAKKKKGEGDQLRIYKKYFAKQYGVDESDIDIEYFIVKRKLYENLDFPQKRIQQYRPPAGKPSMNKTDKILKEFVEKAFVNGKRNPDAEYPAYKTGCTYCPFKKRHDLCNPKQRLTV